MELVRANEQLRQEISERIRTEAELQRLKEYLENVIDNSVDAIGIVDRRGKFILWNRRAAEIYGYQFEELTDKTAFELYADPGELRAACLPGCTRTASSGNMKLPCTKRTAASFPWIFPSAS